jgi:hypothetical protein
LVGRRNEEGRLVGCRNVDRSGRLVGRSREAAKADVAQLAERVLGKDEVTSSILVIGSSSHHHRVETDAAIVSEDGTDDEDR